LSNRSLEDGHHNGEEEDHHHHSYHGVDRAEEHISVNDALARFLNQITPTAFEIVDSQESLNRILGEEVKASFDVPLFDRATRDGYALKIEDGPVHPPAEFKIEGEVLIGERPKIEIRRGTKNSAIRVATGSFLPPGSNAVVMKEYVREGPGNSLIVEKEVKAGQNILRKGEDIGKSSVVLHQGTNIRPHHVALLALVGLTRVKVFRKPNVAFLSTGDELCDATTSRQLKDRKKRIIDINRPFIKSMIQELGAIPQDLGIARDDYSIIRKKILKGLACDVLILSAGSSVGDRDYASKAAESIPNLKVLAHGVAMRPSSPTGLAIYKGKPFIMLPGFPTSMIISFLVFCRSAILKRGGSASTVIPMVKARLIGEYEGKAGLTHFLRLKVVEKDGEYYANIVRPTEAQYSSWLKESNGIGVLDPGSGSVKDNDIVRVFLIGDLKTE
jgi:molybdopterin molybdotransferase